MTNPQRRPMVVKYGGHAMSDPQLFASFAQDAAALQAEHGNVVVVHGGGPQINAMLERLGIATEFRGGLRVTTPEVMGVVGLVLVGDVQRELVSAINRTAPCAVGVSGEDAGLLTARRRAARIDGDEVDIGLVGDVEAVRSGLLECLLAGGYLPVVSSVARDPAGIAHNVNADTAAAAIAAALGAERLVMLTDVDGMYSDWPDSSSLMRSASPEQIGELLPSLDAGMVPKAEACMRAVQAGVDRALIVDGRIPHVLARVADGEIDFGTTISRSGA